MRIEKLKLVSNNILLIIFILIISNSTYAQKAYFDLSQKEINIDTNFKGQELILLD